MEIEERRFGGKWHVTIDVWKSVEWRISWENVVLEKMCEERTGRGNWDPRGATGVTIWPE